MRFLIVIVFLFNSYLGFSRLVHDTSFDTRVICRTDKIGKLHGRYTEKNIEGVEVVKGRMKHGVRVGCWKFKDKKGRLGTKIRYNRNGEIIYSQHNLLNW